MLCVAVSTVHSCHFCGKSTKSARRGLCYLCYKDETIRSLYDPHAMYGSHLGRCKGRKLDDCPTLHRPGSEGKIQIMTDRAEKGLFLFHPNDARINTK